MDDGAEKSGRSWPYRSPLPADPRWRGRARAARVLAYVLVVCALITPVVQFQYKTIESLRGAEGDDSEKISKGAIGRWRRAIRRFWAGQNIYRPYVSPGWRGLEDGIPPKPDVWLHPHMPFAVIVLTPFAYMPHWLMALTFSVLKLLVLAAAVVMAVRVVNHKSLRMPDWVLGLALVWGMLLIVDDIQHGNTNVFVLGAIVFHLWLFRRGWDAAAGVPLALAICLKMTPTLFVVYWLYQRNWKLLAGVAVALAAFIVVVPLAALGPAQYAAQTTNWWHNLIEPGLMKGAWYPIHVNQSISAVFGRYLLDGHEGGDIFWNPDDRPYLVHKAQGQPSEWIALARLSPHVVRNMVRAAQISVLALMAWAIGWRKLPRDDGRRALHYGLVVVGMMLLNQRTWQHHAAVLLIAHLAIWYAIAYGRVRPRLRQAAIWLMLLAGVLVWLDSEEPFKLLARLAGEPSRLGARWSDLAKAYGLTFYHFVLVLVTSVLLSVWLRKSDDPYASRRQRLRS